MNWITKISQNFQEESLSQTVQIPGSEWRPYLVCKIQSVIQHEAAHREQKQQNVSSSETGAKSKEINCGDPPAPSSPISVSKSELFQEARVKANIPWDFKEAVKAVAIPQQEHAWGLFLRTDRPDQPFEQLQRGASEHVFYDENKFMYIDVDSIINDALKAIGQSMPDYRKTHRQLQMMTPATGPAQQTGATPSIPSMEGRQSVEGIPGRV